MNLAQQYHQHNPEAGKGKQYDYLYTKLKDKHPHHSILDYGSGQGGTAEWLKQTLDLDVACYDPGVERYNTPEIVEDRYWDYVYSADVLEHIPLEELKQHTLPLLANTIRDELYLIIDLTPAKKQLPDGTNAHITLLTADEWIKLLSEYLKVHETTTVEQPDKTYGTRTRLCVTARRSRKQ